MSSVLLFMVTYGVGAVVGGVLLYRHYPGDGDARSEVVMYWMMGWPLVLAVVALDTAIGLVFFVVKWIGAPPSLPGPRLPSLAYWWPRLTPSTPRLPPEIQVELDALDREFPG